MISDGPHPETPFQEPKPIPASGTISQETEPDSAHGKPDSPCIDDSISGPAASQVIIDAVVESLLHRMRAGDRHAAAEFVTKYGPRIRRRVRARMNPSMRRIFDSEELLSTMARRLDQFVHEGRMTAENQARLWALVNRIGDNAVVDRYRLMKRLDSIEAADGPAAATIRRRQESSPDDSSSPIAIDEVLDWIVDPRDRQILMLWLHDVPLTTIAECLKMTATAVRKRWQGVREHLRERLDGKLNDQI